MPEQESTSAIHIHFTKLFDRISSGVRSGYILGDVLFEMFLAHWSKNRFLSSIAHWKSAGSTTYPGRYCSPSYNRSVKGIFTTEYAGPIITNESGFGSVVKTRYVLCSRYEFADTIRIGFTNETELFRMRQAMHNAADRCFTAERTKTAFMLCNMGGSQAAKPTRYAFELHIMPGTVDEWLERSSPLYAMVYSLYDHSFIATPGLLSKLEEEKEKIQQFLEEDEELDITGLCKKLDMVVSERLMPENVAYTRSYRFLDIDG